MFAESAADHLSHRSYMPTYTHDKIKRHTYFGTLLHVSAINGRLRALKCKKIHYADTLTF